jgi:CheY-like chemotaxis protein/predicted regulator of Ras-like GTPase activity (Roadblock/LC7/MglB family)
MMPSHRILVVEDQSDVRKMLRSGLETLGPEFEIIDTPSAEEAFLELTRRQFDLLIADVRLAGMSGLELRIKALDLNADIKVILITGVSDPTIRRQTADAGADAFFFKPVAINKLLSTVESLFEGKETTRQDLVKETYPVTKASSPEIIERLAALRDELLAISVVLLHKNGTVKAKVGDPPEAAIKSDLFSMLLQILSSGNKVSQQLGKHIPEDLYCIAGNRYNLSMKHINEDYCLLVVAITGPGAEYLGTIGFNMHLAARDLSKLLAETAPLSKQEKAEEATELIEQSSDREYQETPATDLTETTPDEESQEEIPDMDDIFLAQDGEELSPDEIDAFWDSALEDGEADTYQPTSDSISYDEARERGITPDEDEH